MKTGDTKKAMEQIAPDAVFLESGKLETRAEYEMNHLPADIEFEAQVTGKRGPMKITFEGNTAWVIVMTEYDGEFDKSPVNFTSAQLMVMTKQDGKWLIRSVHWSSRRR
jgi:ketosteroid isomerase-like protein